jgi:hypothetical protein
MIFIFTNQCESSAGYRAEVPPGINSKSALLEALFVALRFPDYFGGNWDALDECIRDLYWLPSGDVVLTHSDLPLSNDRPSLSTYLSILKDAVEKWSATGERKLLVVFPLDAQHVVQSVLAEAQESNGSPGGRQA